MELFEKPNLRSKGSRFGVKTGNSLKFSLADYKSSAKGYGTIRQEQLNVRRNRNTTKGECFDNNELVNSVEYSLNKHKRWELLEDIVETSTDIERVSEAGLTKSKRNTLRALSHGYFASKPVSYCLPADKSKVIFAHAPLHPRLRRQQLSAYGQLLDNQGWGSGCSCRYCRRVSRARNARLQANRAHYSRSMMQTQTHAYPAQGRAPPSKSYIALKQLHKHGVGQQELRTFISTLFEFTSGLQSNRFPAHAQIHNPHRPRRHALSFSKKNVASFDD